MFSPFQLLEGQPDVSWSSNDISLYLKCEYHTYLCVLPKVSSSKASQPIKTVSEEVCPLKRTKLQYTLTVLFHKLPLKPSNMPSDTRRKWQT